VGGGGAALADLPKVQVVELAKGRLTSEELSRRFGPSAPTIRLWIRPTGLARPAGPARRDRGHPSGPGRPARPRPQRGRRSVRGDTLV